MREARSLRLREAGSDHGRGPLPANRRRRRVPKGADRPRSAAEIGCQSHETGQPADSSQRAAAPVVAPATEGNDDVRRIAAKLVGVADLDVWIAFVRLSTRLCQQRSKRRITGPKPACAGGQRQCEPRMARIRTERGRGAHTTNARQSASPAQDGQRGRRLVPTSRAGLQCAERGPRVES